MNLEREAFVQQYVLKTLGNRQYNYYSRDSIETIVKEANMAYDIIRKETK